MRMKLSTNSILKLILMEVVVVFIYFITVGGWIALITWFFSWPYTPIPLPESAFWGDVEYMLDPVKAEYAQTIAFGVIAFLQVIAASCFLDNIRYWLCSLIPQAIIFSSLWALYSNFYPEYFEIYYREGYEYAYFLSNYWYCVITIFATQVIGVLVNYLIRLIIRKIRARKQTALAE